MKSAPERSFVTLLNAAAAFAALAAVVAFVAPALYRARAVELRAERGWSTTPAATRQQLAAQRELLTRYAWIDRANGVVALPIDRAMELCTAESSRVGRPK